MTDKIDSTSDDRTVNNAVRHQYRVLNEDEKAQMTRIKDMGAALIGEIVEMEFGQDLAADADFRLKDRDLELARQHIEDGVMRAVHYITR